MVKTIAFFFVAVMIPFTFAGCSADISEPQYDGNDPGGFGMTYNGKMGYDYGNGFVQPFDGSPPGMGFGF